MTAELRADSRETVRTNWRIVVGLALIVLVGGGLVVGVEVAPRGWSFLAGLVCGLLVAYVVQAQWPIVPVRLLVPEPRRLAANL